MQELDKMFSKQRKYFLYLIGIYAVGVLLTKYDTVFQGLILGTIFSLFIYLSMVQKYKKFSEAITKGSKKQSLGSLTRMSIAALAAVIALRYPEKFQIVSVILGLMTVYFVIMIDYFLQHLRR